jgi:hypothetical protein
MQDSGGVGFEADHHRVRIVGLGPPHDLVDNAAVSAVHAVEITDAEERWTEVAGKVVELVEKLHQGSAYRRDPEVTDEIADSSLRSG